MGGSNSTPTGLSTSHVFWPLTRPIGLIPKLRQLDQKYLHISAGEDQRRVLEHQSKSLCSELRTISARDWDWCFRLFLWPKDGMTTVPQ